MRRKLIGLMIVAAIGITMSACGEEPVSEVSTSEEAVVTELPEITVLSSGTAYDINENSKVLESYEEYNIQAPVNELFADFTENGAQGVEFHSHTVVPAESEAGEDGLYDAVDTMSVVVLGADPMGIMPQRISKDIVYKRDVQTGEWIKTSETHTAWQINNKKFGGKVWKKSTEDGELYIQLNSTMEFFRSEVGEKDGTVAGEFSTTLIGVMTFVENGEMTMKRIHIKSGKLTEDGILELTYDVGGVLIGIEAHDSSLLLNEYTLIDKTQLPYTEGEYKMIIEERTE